MVAGQRTGEPAKLLEAPFIRHAARAGTAFRSTTTRKGNKPRRVAVDSPVERVVDRASDIQPQTRRNALHDSPRGIQAAAALPDEPGRHRRGDGRGEPWSS